MENFDELLKKYADFIVRVGVNPQPGPDPHHQLPAGGRAAGAAVRAQCLRSRCPGCAGELER